MKILLMTVRSDYGGGPRHIHQLIETLSSRMQIYLAYPYGYEPYGKNWDDDKRIVGRFSLPHRRFKVFALLQLIRYVKTNQIDIVHSHGQGAGVYARLLKIFVPCVKVVHTFHGITDCYQNQLKRYLSHFANRILRYWTDEFICVSKGEANLGASLRYLRTEKTHIIYNGIPCPACDGPQRDGLFRVVTLSRFDYQKNMDFAYEIASYFKHDDSIRFMWIGEGDDYERLKQKAIAEGVKIDFIGFSTEPLRYLGSANLYLSTSRFEGLPYALIEACACRLPIVATDVVGNNEVVTDGFNGILFRTKDEAIDAIQRIKSSDIVCHEMSEASWQVYQKSFALEVMIKATESVYLVNCQF